MFKQIVLFMACVVVMAVAFNNCGGSFSPTTADDANLASLSLCERELYEPFAAKIHPFLRTNCAQCHSSGGESGVFFAVPGAAAAFATFKMTGFGKFKSMALNETHAAGVTGAQNQAAVVQMENDWLAAESGANCQAEGVIGGMPAMTTAKTIDATTTDKTITWALDTETEDRGAEFGAATFSIKIRRMDVPNSASAYVISDPTIKAVNASLVARSLSIYINGVKYSDGTTFASLYEDAPANNQNTLLMDASMAKQMDEGIAATDTIAVEFVHLGKGALPTPTPTPVLGATPIPNAPGIAIYERACAGCHNPIANTAKPGRTYNQINGAKQTVTQMVNDPGVQALTPAEIQQIADALLYR